MLFLSLFLILLSSTPFSAPPPSLLPQLLQSLWPPPPFLPPLTPGLLLPSTHSTHSLSDDVNLNKLVYSFDLILFLSLNISSFPTFLPTHQYFQPLHAPSIILHLECWAPVRDKRPDGMGSTLWLRPTCGRREEKRHESDPEHLLEACHHSPPRPLPLPKVACSHTAINPPPAVLVFSCGLCLSLSVSICLFLLLVG